MPSERRERDVHKALVARVKLLGGEVRRVKWIGRRSAPDVLVLLYARAAGRDLDGSPRRARTGRNAYVEEKRPGADAREDQQREHARLRAAGCEVLVIDTLELIDTHFPLT